MTTTHDSAFEFLRHRAGLDLTPSQQTELQRLIKVLRHGSRFQAIFVEINDPALGESLIVRIDEALAAASMPSTRIDLSTGQLADVAALESALHQARAQGKTVIHLVNADRWLNDDRLTNLNLRREALAHRLDCRLVFWLSTALVERVAQRAADLWSWRSGVYNLCNDAASINPLPAPEQYPPRLDTQGGTLAERAKRIVVLKEWLQQTNDDELRLPLLDELASLLVGMGNSDEALAIRRDQELPVYQRLGDMRGQAISHGRIADILQARGELDEALRIRRDEELPVYEIIGDVREKATSLSKVADILRARGELEEAMSIYREGVLPVYEHLGDIRLKAVLQGKIADILQARGELDEALRIRRGEQLPIYEYLGDMREKAVTQGQIADILQARGELDEAMRIRQEDELPVFERLGDMREKVITQGRIADILQARGELDEAMALHQQRLPIAERMQDQASIAHIRYSMASVRLARRDDEHGGMQAVTDDLKVAFAIGCKLDQPDTTGGVGLLLALVLILDGRKDEAICVLDQAEAACRKLGWQPQLAQAQAIRAKIAEMNSEQLSFLTVSPAATPAQKSAPTPDYSSDSPPSAP